MEEKEQIEQKEQVKATDKMLSDKVATVTAALFLLAFVSVIPVGGYIVAKKLNVWGQEQDGKAMLAQAEQTKKIMIETAKAEKEAASLKAEAIGIMGEVAKKYPEYRNQEFITAFGEALKEGKIEQIIYVPTEANIPILEATRQANGGK